MLHASASAPALHRDGGAYAHTQRVERSVPPLALVPLDQLQQMRRRAEKEEERQRRKKPSKAESRRHDKASVQRKCHEQRDLGAEQHDGLRQEERQRLGERFLGMMALLSRLRRMDLEGSDSPAKKQQRSGQQTTPRISAKHLPAETPSPALVKLVEKKRQEQSSGGGGGGRGDAVRSAVSLSPHRKPEPVLNAATEPLREHLTFEISMLLPAPMDTRQSELLSPIQRRKRRKRLKKRRRRKRLIGATLVDGKRTWQTSHATWVPHASSDYAQARAAEGIAASAGSKLVAKFAELRTAVGGAAASSQRRTYIHATVDKEKARDQPLLQRTEESSDDDDERDERASASQEEESEDDMEPDSNEFGVIEEESGDDEEEEEEESEDDDDDADDDPDTLPNLLPSDSSCLSRHRPPLSSSRPPPPLRRPVQTHQAAWISPDLRAWLLDTHLFRTSSSE